MKSRLVSVILAMAFIQFAASAAQKEIRPCDRVVASYVTSWTDVMPDPTLLTQINYAFGHVNDTFDGVRIDNLPRLKDMVALKEQNPRLKVVLSIGGWGSGNFSEMASVGRNRRSFCKDCARLCRELGLDGIDIDWEYPGDGEGAHISWSLNDKGNYTLLMRDLRRALGKGKVLTLASCCDPVFIDFPSVMEYVDYVNIMSYDMGSGDKFHCALYPSENTRTWTTDRSVKAHIEAGVPSDRIVMGVPFYGKGTKEYRGRRNFRGIYPVSGRYTEKWDEQAKVPYLVNDEGAFVFGFENERSLRIKAQYVIDNGLLGMMNWEYADDDDNLSLTRIMHSIVSADAVPVEKSLPRVETSERTASAVDEFISASSMMSAKLKEYVPYACVDVHSVMLLKHGKVIYENWYNGAEASQPHVLYSVSKTFTSSAVGLAISEGKLKLSDRVVDFFPESCPDEISDNLAAMTVRDLLTMTCGQSSEALRILGEDITGIDWIKAFLAHPVEHVPGTYFLYNSVGTYMLSAIVQKVTGEKVVDYLYPRLFQPLGIEAPHWDESPQGIDCGGWGLYLTTEDLAKFGQLLLQGGQWNGKQVLPAEWVREMSSCQVASAPSGTPVERLEEAGLNKSNSDWVQGYGYQMWMTRHNAFRADGAFGQYVIVLPDEDAVIVITSYSYMYQEYLDLVWKYLYPAVLNR